jgi:hypothetical protein
MSKYRRPSERNENIATIGQLGVERTGRVEAKRAGINESQFGGA